MVDLAFTLDTAIFGFILAGSPSFGYIVSRTIWPGMRRWKGWIRLFAGGIIGIGWSLSIFTLIIPLASFSWSNAALVENGGYAAMGLVGLSILTGGLFYLMHRALTHTPHEGIQTSATPQPSIIPPSLSSSKLQQKIPAQAAPYKPSQLKSSPTMRVSPNNPLALDEPVIEDSSTVDTSALKFLKEERSTPSASKQPSAPIEKLSDFAGFEETLTQLQRDLKDFNESVDKHTRSPRRNYA